MWSWPWPPVQLSAALDSPFASWHSTSGTPCLQPAMVMATVTCTQMLQFLRVFMMCYNGSPGSNKSNNESGWPAVLHALGHHVGTFRGFFFLSLCVAPSTQNLHPTGSPAIHLGMHKSAQCIVIGERSPVLSTERDRLVPLRL